ncbi:MAG TPA: DUF4232 domain-containing protein [Gaiellaceae bacterium]|nr:DUF4232 domain-containing protein [Gaiellaceae bacterium]
MSVIAPPESPPHDELEALIREARVRQRRRWLGAAAGVAIAAAIGLGVYASLPRSAGNARQGHAPAGAGSRSSRCRTDQLRVSWIANGASAGEFYTDITLTNLSTRSCALRGWPTVGYLLRGDRRVARGAGHDRNGTQKGALPIRTVVLRPHAAASFNLRTADRYMLAHPPKCVRVRAVLVTPPGSRVALRIRQPGLYCGRALESVTPLVPGRLDHYLVVS